MGKLPNKRSRGVILTPQGWNKLQSAIRGQSDDNTQSNFTLLELSYHTCLSPHTISRILGRTEAVDKSSLQSAFKAFDLELCECDYRKPGSQSNNLENQDKTLENDWGEAANPSVFYGRSQELSQLQNWILEQQCRLITLQGIGGIGKSTLAIKFGMQVQMSFDVVVWRSLQNAPPIDEYLTSVLKFLLWALRKYTAIPESFDGKVSLLMECLKNHRCLLILDNTETILCSDSQGNTGQCCPGYERYGQLLKRIGETNHNSCVLVTSREKIRDIVALEGEKAKVKSLQMGGLHTTEGRKLIEQRGKFIGTEEEWQTLIDYYGGNPLALKMLAAGTQDLFDGRIAPVLEYLQQG
ncbi:MAG: NB-ARC domain-containing protein, partial [Cyanobacteria bacterium J06649_11]